MMCTSILQAFNYIPFLLQALWYAVCKVLKVSCGAAKFMVSFGYRERLDGPNRQKESLKVSSKTIQLWHKRQNRTAIELFFFLSFYILTSNIYSLIVISWPVNVSYCTNWTTLNKFIIPDVIVIHTQFIQITL